ncbi:MAG: acyltransferase [Lachnospiraceae bacterium]|nr:acyltransferase [Lachnospiraceae bacterium]
MEAKKSFNSIDLFKLLMAVAVVAIHTNPIVAWTNPAAIKIVVIIEEWAVPFFFTASGFFLFYNMEKPYKENTRRIDNYLRKIIKLYCVWTLISLPLTIYGYVISGNAIVSCIFSYIKYFLFVGKLYNSYHLWYLLALIYALFAIRFLVKRGLEPVFIFVIALVIYVASEMMVMLEGNIDSIGGMAGKIVSAYQYIFNNGGVFTGMIYVCVGMLIAHYGLCMNKWLGACGMIAINIAKLFAGAEMSRMIMPLEVFVLFASLLTVELPDSRVWNICRKVSTIVYLSHLIFFSIYTIIILGNPNKLGFDSFLVTIMFSVFNAILLINIQNNKGFEWIKCIF